MFFLSSLIDFSGFLRKVGVTRRFLKVVSPVFKSILEIERSGSGCSFQSFVKNKRISTIIPNASVSRLTNGVRSSKVALPLLTRSVSNSEPRLLCAICELIPGW